MRHRGMVCVAAAGKRNGDQQTSLNTAWFGAAGAPNMGQNPKIKILKPLLSTFRSSFTQCRMCIVHGCLLGNCKEGRAIEAVDFQALVVKFTKRFHPGLLVGEPCSAFAI